MDGVRVGSYFAADSLRRRLFYELDQARWSGLQVVVRFDSVGDLRFVECAVKEEDPLKRAAGRDVLRHHIGVAVAHVILEDLQEAMAADQLARCHPELEPAEIAAISDYAMVILAESLNGIGRPEDRFREVAYLVSDYLATADTLIVEGFLTFRLRGYARELSRACDEALDRFMADREHREFVRLLKYFVDMQDQREAEVHVVRGRDNLFGLLNRDLDEIENEYLEVLAADLTEGGIELEDLLISALITASPGRIVLHVEPDRQIAETLESVFEGKVARCRGCDLNGCEMGRKAPAQPAK
ncbi:MAG: putative sporulation protein YtxC [Firmicutes bacterium]|jgi:putative sporulation protein YtxC|nr:putative sporulation protein YtxC [Bacillota bacterium]